MPGYKYYLKHAFKLLIYCIYPVLELYGYFVFCGIFCLENREFNQWLSFIIYVIYNYLLLYKIVIYLALFTIEDKSTLNFFTCTDKNSTRKSFKGMNPYVIENMLDRTSENVKICEICKTYKPHRAHHSSVMNRCYLKYDHHCIWLDIVIGYHNYKSFYLFLCVNMLTWLIFLIIIGIDLIMKMDDDFNVGTINYIICIILYFIAAVFNGFLLIKHSILISRNETTVECLAIDLYLKHDYSMIHVFQEGNILNFSPSTDRRILNPYNIGIQNNWAQVFGHDKLKWLQPINTSLSNGLKFKNNYENEENDVELYI